MKAIAKLITAQFPHEGMSVVYKLSGKLVLTEVNQVEKSGILKGTATIGVLGATSSVSINELKNVVAQTTSISNGYKDQPDNVYGFIEERETKNHELDIYSIQKIIDNDLIDKEIEIEPDPERFGLSMRLVEINLPPVVE